MTVLKDRTELSYAVFWAWLVVVSVASIAIYVEAARLLASILYVSAIDIDLVKDLLRDSWLEWPVLVLGGILVWWRVVKVVVLQGSPFLFGVQAGKGRQDDGKRGRLVARVLLGDENVYGSDYKGVFLYGAVFRMHPNSDKLMRSRLELLVLTLPRGVTFIVHESRLFLRKMNNAERARLYRSVADAYSATSESMKPDRFRAETVRHLREIGNYFRNQTMTKRIDGFNWHFMMGGKGYIMDDFGYRISFEALEGGKFKVSELGSKADEMSMVESVAELRELAKRELSTSSE